MNTNEFERIREASARRSKSVAIYYLVTILMGAFLLLFHGRAAFSTALIVSVCYIAVTAVFYESSKPLSGRLSGRK